MTTSIFRAAVERADPDGSHQGPFSDRCLDSRVQLTVAHDADEQARNLHGWRQTYDQLSAGRFRGTIAELFLDRMTVFREFTSRALRQTCEIDSDAYWFGISLGSDALGRIDGRPIDEGALAFRPSGVEFELLTPEGYEFFGIVVNGEALRRYAAEVEEMTLIDRAPETEVIAAAVTRKHRLCALLRPILTEAAGNAASAPLSSQPLSQAAREHLQACVLASLFDLCTDERARLPIVCTPQRRHTVVADAREYVLAHRDRPVSVVELCAQLHVSRRTLQYCFQDVLGMAPAAYLRTIRLNGARRDLSDAARDGGGSSAPRQVQDVAAAWGFWHLSQFAADYRRLFGVRPSDTLKGIGSVGVAQTASQSPIRNV